MLLSLSVASALFGSPPKSLHNACAACDCVYVRVTICACVRACVRARVCERLAPSFPVRLLRRHSRTVESAVVRPTCHAKLISIVTRTTCIVSPTCVCVAGIFRHARTAPEGERSQVMMHHRLLAAALLLAAAHVRYSAAVSTCVGGSPLTGYFSPSDGMRGTWAKGDGVLQVFNTVSVEDCADKCDVEKSDVCFGFSYVACRCYGVCCECGQVCAGWNSSTAQSSVSVGKYPGTMPPQP